MNEYDRMKVMSMPCPACGADEFEPCFPEDDASDRYGVRRNPHSDRFKAAQRYWGERSERASRSGPPGR